MKQENIVELMRSGELQYGSPITMYTQYDVQAAYFLGVGMNSPGPVKFGLDIYYPGGGINSLDDLGKDDNSIFYSNKFPIGFSGRKDTNYSGFNLLKVLDQDLSRYEMVSGQEQFIRMLRSGRLAQNSLVELTIGHYRHFGFFKGLGMTCPGLGNEGIALFYPGGGKDSIDELSSKDDTVFLAGSRIAVFEGLVPLSVGEINGIRIYGN